MYAVLPETKSLSHSMPHSLTDSFTHSIVYSVTHAHLSGTLRL